MSNKNSNKWSFVGGNHGAWRVTSQSSVCGEAMSAVESIEVFNGDFQVPVGAAWTLCGLTSHVHYAHRAEVEALRAIQPPLGRIEASCAALIPIRKSAAWWELAQDERRAIFEENSHHNAVGLEYLPAIARRLHHSRDIGEPFDFLTWFEFAPQHTSAFDEMLQRLRAAPEWSFVEREVDIRLVRAD